MSKKVKDMDSELSSLGVAKERIESILSKYKKDLENESARASELEDHLSHEQDKSASLESELDKLRKRLMLIPVTHVCWLSASPTLRNIFRRRKMK